MCIRRIAVIVLTLGVLVAFSGTLRNDFVSWDDDYLLQRNERYRGLDSQHLRWMFTTNYGGHYQPLTWLSFAIESQLLWGVNAAGFHFTNLVLHLGTSIAFFFVARRILELVASDRWPVASGNAGPKELGHQGTKHLGDEATRRCNGEALGTGHLPLVTFAALVAALFWAVHPLRVESVAWATERRDVLSGALLMLTVLAYLRYASGQKRRSLWLALSLTTYVLSLLSKAVGMTLPVLLLLLDVYPLRRLSPRAGVALCGRGMETARFQLPSAGDKPRRYTVWLEKLMFAIPAAAAAAAAIWAQSEAAALRSFIEHPVSLRVTQAFYGIIFYLAKTLWPRNLVPLYEQPPLATPWEPEYIAAAVLVLLLTLALALLRRRWPGLLAAWLAYLVLLSPMLGLAQSGPQFAADRYTYLPSMPLALLVGAGAAWAWRRISFGAREMIVAQHGGAALGHATPGAVPGRKRGCHAGVRGAFALAWLGVLAAMIALTRAQVHAWRDSLTLWTTVVERRPNTGVAHANLAVELNYRGEFEAARNHALTALELLPGNRSGHAALSRASRELGDWEAADRHGRIALGIAEKIGDVDAPTLVNLAIVQVHQGRDDQAEQLYQRAIAAEPREAQWRFDLAGFLASRGRYADAKPWFEQSIELEPSRIDAYLRLAIVHAALREYARAIEVLQTGLTQNPDDPGLQVQLAWVLATCPEDGLRDGRRAAELARKALAASGGTNKRDREVLAAALAENGDFEQALATLEPLVISDPTLLPDSLKDRLAAQIECYRARRAFRE